MEGWSLTPTREGHYMFPHQMKFDRLIVSVRENAKNFETNTHVKGA
jgi:hypothetical protein